MLFRDMNLASAILVLLLTSRGKADPTNCLKQDFGHGSFVCVCSSDHCDFYDPIEPLPVNEAHVIVSDSSSRRFETSQQTFDKIDGSKNSRTFPHEPSDDQNIKITIDQGKKFQKLIGFGGAFTDAAGINIASLPQDLQTTLLRSYYADNGLSYNIGRLNMGGCDFSTRPYSYDDVEGDNQLQHFNLAKEDTDFKIPYVKTAREIRGEDLTLFASPWSAPAWMKTNNDFIGKGELKVEHYQTWADYFIRFLDEYKKHGINFWGLTAMNEPTNGFQPDFPFNCMGWNATTQGEWIGKYFGPTLMASNHSDIKLMILDDQRPLAPNWCREIFANKEAEKFIGGVAVHWYLDREFDLPLALDQVHQEFPDKFIMYTEACTGDRPWEGTPLLGSWDRGEQYLYNIIEDLNHWVTGWTDWNLALDLKGGPNWVGNFVDAPIIVDEQQKLFYKNPMWYALGHISRFAPAASIKIGLEVENMPKKMSAVALQRPDGGIAVVVLNRDKMKTYNVTVVDSSRGNLPLSVPPSSFTTVVYY